MPAAVLAGGLAALIWALLAIVILTIIRQLIVQPIFSASSAVSGLPVIGGALAWAVYQIGQVIQIGLDGLWWIVEKGTNDAMYWWDFLVVNTIRTWLWEPLGYAYWVRDNFAGLNNVLHSFGALWYQAWSTIPSAIVSLGRAVGAIAFVIDNDIWPYIRALGVGLASIAGYVYGPLTREVNGIGSDLHGLRDWLGSNTGLLGLLAALRAQALADARALTVPIEAEVEAIRDSPCQRFCGPLGDLGQLLQGLEDAGMVAIMIALVETAMHDPGSVEREIANDVAPVIKSVVSSLGLGIPE